MAEHRQCAGDARASLKTIIRGLFPAVSFQLSWHGSLPKMMTGNEIRWEKIVGNIDDKAKTIVSVQSISESAELAPEALCREVGYP